MKDSFWKKFSWQKILSLFFVLALLSACATEDKPFSLTGDENSPAVVPVGDGSGDGGGGPEGCVVTATGDFQLKISADPTGSGDPEIYVDKLDAQPDPIILDLEVNGSDLIFNSANFPFPQIVLDDVSDQVDLRISGTPGVSSSASFDESGHIEFSNVSFDLEMLTKGTQDNFGGTGTHSIGGITLSTAESVKATGNLNDITENGLPLDPGTLDLTLVAAVTLPSSFPNITLLNDVIGGGALTVRFRLNLSQLPEDCTAGGGGGSGGGGGGGPTGVPPSDFQISVGAGNVGSYDFGTAFAEAISVGGKQVMNCSELRPQLSKNMVITNTSSDQDLEILIAKPADTDGDAKDPGCSGAAEFVRGMVVPQGAATCSEVQQGAHPYPVLSCKIPPKAAAPSEGEAGGGGEEGAGEVVVDGVMFPIMYVPYNLPPAPEAPPEVGADTGGETTGGEVPPAEGEEPPVEEPSGGGAAPTVTPDTGLLNLQYRLGGGELKEYDFLFSGTTEKELGDTFAIAKVVEGIVSENKILNNGLLKIALSNEDTTPFVQTVALSNSGTDAWQISNIEIQQEDESIFSVAMPADSSLPAASGGTSGEVRFDLTFAPGANQVSTGRMIVTLNRPGTNTEVTFEVDLSGTVGIPPLEGKVMLHLYALTAKIDNVLTTDPVNSEHFKFVENNPPPPLELLFEPVEGNENLKKVSLQGEDINYLDKSLDERIASLRILNAQATSNGIGPDYSNLGPQGTPGDCDEPTDAQLARAYDPSENGCSYFAFGFTADSENPAYYDDSTGELNMSIFLRMQNPYHFSIIGGQWGLSDPFANPTLMMDVTMKTTFYTGTLDGATAQIGGKEVNLLPDPRISSGDLKLTGKSLGDPCPEDSFGTDFPTLLCFVTSDGKYMQGRNIEPNPENPTRQRVRLVGVAYFGPDSNQPLFLNDTRMYIAIDGELEVIE